MSSEETNRHSMEEPFRDVAAAAPIDESPSDRQAEEAPSESNASALPPQPEDVRIPGASSVVSWVGSDGHERFLPQKTELFIQYHTEPTNSIFIRLQCRVAHTFLHASKPRPLYVFIRPQYVRSLVVSDETTLAPDVRDVADKTMVLNGAWCLSFVMNEPGVLVVPKDYDPSRLNTSADLYAQQNLALFDSLKELMAQNAFCVRIPRQAVAENPLLYLSNALSTPGLLKTDARLDNMSSLYGGRGGKTFTPDASGDAPQDDAPPPTYEAAQANASEPSSSSKVKARNKKRRRESTPNDSPPPSEKKDASPVTLEMITSRIDTLIDERIDERINSRTDDAIHARIDEHMVSYIDQLIDARIGNRIDAAITEHLKPIESRLSHLETLPKGSPKGEFDDLRYDFEKDVQSLREETEDLLTVRFEEEISEAKKDIHDYARAQVEDAKKDIIKQLRKEPLKCVVNMEFDSN